MRIDDFAPFVRYIHYIEPTYMYDGRTNLSLQVAEEVKRHFPRQVFPVVVPRNVRLSEAPSHGMPVIAYDRLSRGAVAYTAVAEEFLKRGGN